MRLSVFCKQILRFALVLGVSAALSSRVVSASESILWNFDSGPTTKDGQDPYGDLLMDARGNLYGTTFEGGAYQGGGEGNGAGTVFEVLNGYGS